MKALKTPNQFISVNFSRELICSGLSTHGARLSHSHVTQFSPPNTTEIFSIFSGRTYCHCAVRRMRHTVIILLSNTTEALCYRNGRQSCISWGSVSSVPQRKEKQLCTLKFVQNQGKRDIHFLGWIRRETFPKNKRKTWPTPCLSVSSFPQDSSAGSVRRPHPRPGREGFCFIHAAFAKQPVLLHLKSWAPKCLREELGKRRGKLMQVLFWHHVVRSTSRMRAMQH